MTAAQRCSRRYAHDDFTGNPLFTPAEAALLVYGAKLCRTPESMCEADIDALRALGVSDTEILEAVQSTACFAYWVRFINALGVQLGEETIGKYADSGHQINSCAALTANLTQARQGRLTLRAMYW